MMLGQFTCRKVLVSVATASPGRVPLNTFSSIGQAGRSLGLDDESFSARGNRERVS
jgi:hypothetical protein